MATGHLPHVLVTGASSGIGHACATALRHRGFAVHGSVRSEADADVLREAGIAPVQFDVTDGDAVAAGLEQVRAAAGGNLRGVVANAGIAVPGPLEELDPDELLRQLDVNVVGVHRCVAPLVDDLVATGGRIVLMSSIAGRIAAPMLGAYHTSKFALEGYGDTLRRELAPHGVEVVLVEPGPVATPIFETSMPSDEEFARIGPRYHDLARRVADGILADAGDAVPAAEVAAVVVEALTVRRPRTRYPLPRDVAVATAVLPRLPDRLADRLVRARLRG